jgi:hypothetical protein
LKGDTGERSASRRSDVRGDGYVEVAAPWPHEERVKVATTSPAA